MYYRTPLVRAWQESIVSFETSGDFDFFKTVVEWFFEREVV